MIINKSIRKVLNLIKSREMILPALQREFIWKRRDIEGLFDSLLQEFPSNTLMFWNVKDIKGETMEFYEFLEPNYQESVSINSLYPVKDNERKIVVIDGQQRLTSLYIAIYGSYTLEKGKNKMYLYLNLDKPLDAADDDDSLNTTENHYEFRFLTEEKADRQMAGGEHWIRVSDAYAQNFNYVDYLIKNNLGSNDFACKTIEKLVMLFKEETLVLNAYEIEDKDLQHVLNVFVRTNSGGRPLTKGDLLLSVITVNWADKNHDNARDYVQNIVSKAYNYGYKVDKDWVLGCILYILNRDIKLAVENFDIPTSQEIQKNKDSISSSIESACFLLNKFGVLERGLTTKLALYPIVYHIYHHMKGKINGFSKGVKLPVEEGEYVKMRTWLFRAIATNLFEAGTRETLRTIQDIQKKFREEIVGYFPLNEVVSRLEKLQMTDENIVSMLQTEKRRAFPILNIIYSTTKDRAYLSPKIEYDIDHIHAKSLFVDNLDDQRFDLIPNLQLLSFDENRSKNAMALGDWWNAKSATEKLGFLLPEKFDTDLKSFNQFYNDREKWFGAILAEKLDVKDSKYASFNQVNENNQVSIIEPVSDSEDIKSKAEAIINKYRQNPAGDLGHFIRQCESSARLEEEGLKEE